MKIPRIPPYVTGTQHVVKHAKVDGAETGQFVLVDGGGKESEERGERLFVLAALPSGYVEYQMDFDSSGEMKIISRKYFEDNEVSNLLAGFPEGTTVIAAWEAACKGEDSYWVEGQGEREVSQPEDGAPPTPVEEMARRRATCSCNEATCRSASHGVADGCYEPPIGEWTPQSGEILPLCAGCYASANTEGDKPIPTDEWTL